jgi:hypothetical protein
MSNGLTRGRSFFTTNEGYIGLGPRSMSPEDEIFVIIGCHTPLFLREAGRSQYQVIGEGFISGMMNAEAILGALPDQYQHVAKYYDHPTGCGYYPAYRHNTTCDVHWGDPRLMSFDKRNSQLETPLDSQKFQNTITLEGLKQKQGVNFQNIELI